MKKSTLNDFIKRLKQSRSITKSLVLAGQEQSANDRQQRRCWWTGVEPGGCSTYSLYSVTDCERSAY